jgi:hypothetical protein
MSDSVSSGFPSETRPRSPSPTAGPAPWLQAPPISLRRPSPWPARAAWVIALIALDVRAIGWFRPVPRDDRPLAPPRPTFTEQQIADAKAKIRASYKVTRDEVHDDTHRPNPGYSDEIRSIAVANNSRLAIHAAGNYLLDRLAAEPATPPYFARLSRSLADTYLEASMHALNNVSPSARKPLGQEIDSYIPKIDGVCK